MTGREKIEAALSPAGAAEIPVVIPYQEIMARDHWEQLTTLPWWHMDAPDAERQFEWRRQMLEELDQDWFNIFPWSSRAETRNVEIEERPDGVFRIDRRTGAEERLVKAPPGGGCGDVLGQTQLPMPETFEEIDRAIPLKSDFDPKDVLRKGRGELAAKLMERFGERLYPLCYVSPPLFPCCEIWGFENLMVMVATRPDLARHAFDRMVERNMRAIRSMALLGAAGVFIEDCYSDMLHPASWEALCLPALRRMVEEIRALGMRSLHYFCGNPAGKWELLLATGADALGLEESKKGFTADVEELAERCRGRCAVMGNLDAIGVLAKGTEEELRSQVARQISAGRRNGGRFILSLGSPVTPATPIERVRQYLRLAREIGKD